MQQENTLGQAPIWYCLHTQTSHTTFMWRASHMVTTLVTHRTTNMNMISLWPHTGPRICFLSLFYDIKLIWDFDVLQIICVMTEGTVWTFLSFLNETNWICLGVANWFRSGGIGSPILQGQCQFKQGGSLSVVNVQPNCNNASKHVCTLNGGTIHHAVVVSVTINKIFLLNW